VGRRLDYLIEVVFEEAMKNLLVELGLKMCKDHLKMAGDGERCLYWAPPASEN
jgi:hypothetical protein